MIIVDCEQGGAEWFAEKAGVPSASHFSEIVTESGVPSKSQQGYIDKLAAEAITGECEQGYKSGPMSEGTRREAESGAFYELIYSVNVKKVGFVYPDDQRKYGCSPDGLLETWGLEMKNPLPKTQVRYLREGKLPVGVGYYQQIQGALLITGYDRWDFFSYVPKLPPFILQVGRDEKFIAKLKEQLESFCFELAKTIKKIKGGL